MHVTELLTLGAVQRSQPAGGLLNGLHREALSVNSLRIVTVQTQRSGSHSGCGTSHSHHAARILQGHRLTRHLESLVSISLNASNLRLGRRGAEHVTLSQAHTTNIDAAGSLHTRLVTEHELSRAAAQVEHQGVAIAVTDSAHRTREGQRSFLIPADDLGLNTQNLADTVHEHLAVTRIASRTGRHETHRISAVLLQQLRVLTRRSESTVQCLLRQPTGRVHALTQTHNAHLTHNILQDGLLNPVHHLSSGISNQQANRVRTAVNRTNAHGGFLSGLQ